MTLLKILKKLQKLKQKNEQNIVQTNSYRKTFTNISIYLVILTFSFSCCSTGFTTEAITSKNTSIVFKDSLNREVTLKSLPKRIVISGRAGFMITNAAFFFQNASKRLIAYPKNSQVKNLTSFYKMLDSGHKDKIIANRNINVESIAALKPDLVLLKEYEAPKCQKSFEQLGIPVAFFNLENPDKFDADIIRFGAIFGEPNKAKEIVDFFAKWKKIVKQKIISEKTISPKVLVIFYSEREGGISFNVAPSHWIQTLMVERANGIPVWKNTNSGKGWQKVSFDQIATWNPDYVFITSYFGNVSKAKSKILNNNFWKLLNAYKNKQIYAFPEDFVSWDQPDSRWILGLFWMAMRLDGKVTKEEISKFNKLYADFYSLYGFSQEQSLKFIKHGDLF